MLATVAATAAPAAVHAKPDPVEAMVERINAARADHHLPPLRPAPRLMRSARQHAAHLMSADAFGHAPMRIAGFRATGEMLAFTPGWRLATGRVVRMWLNSSGHRAVMLSRSFRNIGVGPVRGRFGGALTTMWVVQVGRR
ncbi:MAG TPA: CAP domain-containing protein [Thermoleophilaceae bacterium]|nr:CAP domain-containing protein [Thermoleophilaceae bacterium]